MRGGFRRFILCACVACMVPALLLGFAFLLPAQFDRTYLAGLQDKLDLLEDTEGNRIVLIGGSGASFDIRSDLVETEFPDYSAVNFGLYAGLGTTVMLDLAGPYLHTGDIVVFLPEQNAQTLSTFFDAERLWQALDGDYARLRALPGSYYERMLGAFPAFAAQKARYCWDKNKPAGDAVYARSSFNAYGDIACAGRERNVMGYGFDPNMMIRFEEDLCSDAFFEKINGFSAACGKKGISFYYAFCPMNAAAVLPEQEENMERFQAFLEEKLNCPVINTAASAVMDAGWFFDTNFHLNEAGQIAYTAELCAALKKARNMTESVSIPVPEMPIAETIRRLDGDNRDADLFLYERAGEGYRIHGLTQAGKLREELILPSRYRGLPVIGFRADTFAFHDGIRQITVYSNIMLIEDGSFDGCVNLERIILKNEFPQTCSVGRDLLKGTNARIVVPQGAFSAYATNYFWAQHMERIEEERP